jgi:hypothetical protein
MKQKPTIFKLTNCNNPSVKDNIGIGDVDLLNADNVKNLNAEGNILIAPDNNHVQSDKQWHERAVGKIIIGVIIGLIILIATLLVNQCFIAKVPQPQSLQQQQGEHK